MRTRSTLRLWGRTYPPFASALAKQGAALDELDGAGGVETRLIEISDLEHRVLDGDLALSGESDVLLLNTDWLPRCVERGLLLDVKDRLVADPPVGWPDAWVPSLRELQEGENGAIYGLPYHDGPMMVLFRRDLFEEHGISDGFSARFGYQLAPPETWDEFIDQAEFFTDRESGRWGTIFAGYPDAHNTVYDFLTQLWGRGGDVIDGSANPSLDTAAALAAAEWLSDLWQRRHIVNPSAAGWDSVASGLHFAAGEAALMVNWCGFASLAADPSSPVHGRLGCAPVPGVAGGTRVTMNSYWILAIPKGSRQPDRAWKFLRSTASPEMDRVTAEEGATAVRRDTWGDRAVRSSAPYYEALEDAHRHSRSVWRDPRWPAVADVLNVFMSHIVAGIGEPRSCLERAQEQLASLLKRGV